jgi:preprotein translocase subunit SecE
LGYSLKPQKFIRLDDENDKIYSKNFQKELKTKNYSIMRKFGRYLRETYDELVNKVTWPSADDLQSSVVVVSIASLIIALIVWLMDVFFSWFMGLPFMFPPLS